MCRLEAHKKKTEDPSKRSIPGGIRTHDLRIRSPARYPLRYGDLYDTKIKYKHV